jgi:uncharacterized membrane protein
MTGATLRSGAMAAVTGAMVIALLAMFALAAFVTVLVAISAFTPQ